MTKQQRHLKLVVSNKLVVVKNDSMVLSVEEPEEKVSWWRKLSWHSKTQVFVFAILIGSIVGALVLHWLRDWHTATAMWMLSSFCLFLIWALEYRLRMDSDPFNKPL
ncbi:MAG: hypothetical protein UW27_C0001G0028 [Parcubacteria group bacterium GW2011_GWA1_44_13]|uniref:Uncharacterized protein n=1 Tax=Candidatus Nomurabacteria bacterium GW2011_GWB1_44_12 TaxID=1618748 RepID=A0A837I7U9_9BACT|nr:MAG: hypothetical protein UW17_C0035G0004 [Candidatus Nomurabacteria bacterium GW2011_GWD1_44_10]KKT37221.1 MAG: hypothetical protein UW25_C0001G0029 [Candidatus Nomurabacteria bacterium GW2011_GWB1_44_12]KKT38532.1 MAG: hypothetical protein UW27_C0001G0028 [Parcubacteria group bacterium GW2011_GWA1_44_13]KKT60932.1 MAG: hypothetical protein UW54_C0001G0013 [Parcubacteria group bacterium GW2011_GWC1_44_26]HBB44469.1 hypothetical protein [Candidatus Yonathbacteria bacterium]